jgi:capsule biosynthesis phosphatase
MNYNKKIQCDIDDCISSTTNRDWENAIPNFSLIKKLNDLYDEGWEIWYITARGNLSCKSRKEAEEKYKPIILKWFKQHNVKFTGLSFDKILAAYYIDDKAILPEDFVNLKIETLQGGLSGAIIERRGDKVFKTHKNSLNSAQWYKKASNVIKTLNVYSVIGDTLCIDYIKQTDIPQIEQMIFIIEKFKSIPSNVDFSTYKNRIIDHLIKYKPNYYNKVINLLDKYKDFFNSNKTFCHGDFTLDNMINSNGILYLIDPIYLPEVYSSYLLDISKLMQSAKRFEKNLIYDYFVNKYIDIIIELQILELTHWIRMRSYYLKANNNANFVDKNIQILLEEIC